MNETPNPLDKLTNKLKQARLLSLIKILKVEFYNDIEYYIPPKQRRVHLADMLRVEIPLDERKKTMIDEIREQVCRTNNYEELINKCVMVERYVS